MSNFNYCLPTWHFCVETNTIKIEKKTYKKGPLALFQEIMTLHGAMKMVVRSQLPSLKVRYLQVIVLESLKILNNLSPLYLNDLLTFKPHSYYFMYTMTVESPQVHVRTSRYGTWSLSSTPAKM